MKYYIKSIENKSNEWIIKEENSNNIEGNFTSKELAIQFANELCKEQSHCVIVVNDTSTRTISLDNT